MTNNFSENLKQLRLENGLSQKELAEKIGTTLKTVSHWETGYTEPNIDQIIALSMFFKVDICELLCK